MLHKKYEIPNCQEKLDNVYDFQKRSDMQVDIIWALRIRRMWARRSWASRTKPTLRKDNRSGEVAAGKN